MATNFNRAYRRVATIIGVSLADGSDQDKAFDNVSEGKVLGVMFDLVNWTWRLPEEKMVPIIRL